MLKGYAELEKSTIHALQYSVMLFLKINIINYSL